MPAHHSTHSLSHNRLDEFSPTAKRAGSVLCTRDLRADTPASCRQHDAVDRAAQHPAAHRWEGRRRTRRRHHGTSATSPCAGPRGGGGGHRGGCPARCRRGACRAPRLVDGPVGHAGVGDAPRRGPAGRPLSRPAQRGDDPRAEQERAAGGDRRRVRARRLLALERALRRAPPGGAADLIRGPVESHGSPAPRGVRPGHHPLQLHVDRGQPADRACAHGQHGRVETGDDGTARSGRDHGDPRGRGDAAGRDQPRRRPGCGGVRGGGATPRARRHPFHRIHRHVPDTLGHGCRQSRPIQELSAAGRRDRGQGLRARPSLGFP